MPIPPREYRQRFAALQSLIAKAGLDLFLVSDFDSIYYLTGAGFEPLERPFFLIVWPDTPPVLLVPRLDYEHMKKAHNVPDNNLRNYREYPALAEHGWPQRLKEEIGTAQQLGIERTLRQEIAQELLEYSLRMTPLVDQSRLIKSSAEVAMIRRAARHADFGVERLLAASYYSSTVAEGFAENRTVNAQIIRAVDDWDPLTSRLVMATWAAPRSAMPHSIPHLTDRLREGPHVALVLTRVNGYAAESERTYFTASPTAEARNAFNAMMQARRIAFAMIRPGVACHELDAKVNEFLGAEGYGGEEQRLHRTGHGIGLGTHEGPWVAEGSEDRLAENMVISIEPGIYLKGVGGVRHSDTVLVTQHGHELLTRLPTNLEQLVIRQRKTLARWRGRLVHRTLALSRKEVTARRTAQKPPLNQT